MEFKTLVWIGITIGGFIGGYVPALWGSDLFSMSGIFFSGVGSLLGIWVAYKLSH